MRNTNGSVKALPFVFSVRRARRRAQSGRREQEGRDGNESWEALGIFASEGVCCS